MSEEALKFDVIPRATLSSQVAETIRARIDSGDIPPRTRLPSERGLSEAFGVSRVAIREAIQLLQAREYVEIRPGTGTFVVDPAIRNASTLQSWVGARDDQLEMMVELRMVVECGIAALAAEKASPAAAAELLTLARKLEECAPEDAPVADSDFHRMIARTTGNDLISELLSACLDITKPLRVRTLKDAGRRHLAAQGHIAIALAIAAKDPVAARAAMTSHLIDARASL